MNDPHDPPRDLDEALDALPPHGGTAEVSGPRGAAEVELVEVDRLGVRVRGLKATHAEPRDVAEQARELPERLRQLGEAVEPVEVDRGLGGAILRTRPDELRREPEFYEVEVRPGQAEVKRYRVEADGERQRVDWVMTRDGLKRLLDDLQRQ